MTLRRIPEGYFWIAFLLIFMILGAWISVKAPNPLKDRVERLEKLIECHHPKEAK